jgi:phosphate transport system protein
MKRSRPQKTTSSDESREIALRACRIARDAASNARDYLQNGTRMGFIAVQQCEKELDVIERQVDDSTPAAITQVSETDARELLACLKFTIDLERIGDLIWSAVRRYHELPRPLSPKEGASLTRMAEILEEMLVRVHDGFVSRDLELAESVMKMDAEMDHKCHLAFRQYLEKGAGVRSREVTSLLFMAQAFERAGDHTKNLAEELFHLIEGRSIRHVKKARQTGVLS